MTSSKSMVFKETVRVMVRFEYCVPHHSALVINSHPSSVSRRECLPNSASASFSNASMTTTAPDCQNRIDTVTEGIYPRAAIKPLYRLIRDQGYESVDWQLCATRT